MSQRWPTWTWLMAGRYLRWNRPSGSGWHFSQWIAAVSLAGLGLGTAALLLVLSVYNGLEELTLGMYNRFNPTLKVSPVEGMHLDADAWIPLIKGVEGVQAVSATLQTNALLKVGDKEALVWVKGVDSAFFDVIPTEEALVWPKVSDSAWIKPWKGGPWALLGVGLAERLVLDLGPQALPLRIYVPRQGARWSAISPEQAFAEMPLVVEGLFDFQPEVNQEMVLMDLDSLQARMGWVQNRVGALEILTQPQADPDRVQQNLRRALDKARIPGQLRIQNRLEQESALLKIFAAEKWWTFAFLLFIVGLASLNLVGSLSMLMLQKRNDLEILAVLGARPTSVASVFWLAGMGIVTAGALLGLVMGAGLVLLQEWGSLVTFPGQSGLDPIPYPVHLLWTDAVWVFLGVLVVGAIFAWIPARRASVSQQA
ncbi:MAG: ABC transporter permease [Bacteroidia bacterium]